MDENDKLSGWLVIITFLALALAIMFAFFELTELRETFTATPLF